MVLKDLSILVYHTIKIMKDIIIRAAVKDDCERLLELIHELALYEKAPAEVTVTLNHFIESGFGAIPVWKAFVAASPHPTGGGKDIVQAFALYYVRYSTWKGQRMYLEDLLVTESMRCKGLGKMLFDRLIEEAKEKKFSGIVWQVLSWNEPAISFYKKYNATLDEEWINCSISI